MNCYILCKGASIKFDIDLQMEFHFLGSKGTGKYCIFYKSMFIFYFEGFR